MSGTDQTAAALFRAGKLDDAVAAAQAALRKAPTDLNARVLLGELLAFTGNLERADVVLDAASAIDPTTALVVAEFRQLIRADMARRQLFRDGRVPEFLADPTEAQRLQLAALVALRAGDMAEAARQAEAAEAARPRAPGKHGDAAFDDLRDADDLLAGSFEVLTTTGKYFWIPDRARADAGVPRAEASARSAVAARVDVGRDGSGWRGLSSRRLRRRRSADRCAAPRPRDRLARG